jgi:hypothetical protein
MTAISEIEADLDWRERELAILRIYLSDKHVSGTEKNVLFRAAWALLYAHYEGFCKFALSVYFDKLERSGVNCDALASEVQCFALTDQFKTMRNLPASDLLVAALTLQTNHLSKPPVFPAVDTRSNLHPDVLQQLLDQADLSIPSLSSHYQTLKTLVRRRNKIAHGERDMIQELSYYLTFENAFKNIAYELAYAIDDKLGGA